VASKILVNINTSDGAETAAIDITKMLFNLFETLFDFIPKLGHPLSYLK
jgi:hypothetical protein